MVKPQPLSQVTDQDDLNLPADAAPRFDTSGNYNWLTPLISLGSSVAAGVLALQQLVQSQLRDMVKARKQSEGVSNPDLPSINAVIEEERLGLKNLPTEKQFRSVGFAAGAAVVAGVIANGMVNLVLPKKKMPEARSETEWAKLEREKQDALREATQQGVSR